MPLSIMGVTAPEKSAGNGELRVVPRKAIAFRPEYLWGWRVFFMPAIPSQEEKT